MRGNFLGLSFAIYPTRLWTTKMIPQRRREFVEMLPSIEEKPAAEHINYINLDLVLPLATLIPSNYWDWYEPGLCGIHGERPQFERERNNLVDWHLNDTRSLLIVPCIRSEWQGHTPTVLENGYHVVVISPDAPDIEIARSLAKSDLYSEHLDFEVRLELATSTVDRVWSSSEEKTLPVWRHMVENYLLNLACEAQCRIDFRQCLNQLRQSKRKVGTKPSVSTVERCRLWQTCQGDLYRRLGLDWPVDDYEP